MANEFTYRADHIGPLIVPAALAETRKRHAAGEVGVDGLREAENAAVQAAVGMQRSAGVSVITDGGFRRADRMAVALDGGKLAKTEAAPLRSLSKRPIKIAVPAARRASGESSDSAFVRAGVVRKEIEALVAAGVDYIQLDAPGYSSEPNQVLDELLQLDTAALSDIVAPSDVRIAMYLVQPNGAIDLRASQARATVERLFQTMPVDRFILPLDAADKDFDLLRLVPKGKLVALGLISTSRLSLENIDNVMTWIDEAAKRIDGDGLALSTASGFSATAGSAMSEPDQKRKLELIAEIATRWWGFAM